MLISQHEHSRISGELARLVGNAMFAPPSPFEPVIQAIAEHDCGWDEEDTHPAINSHGQPAHVFETDPMVSIAAWQSSVDAVAARDGYSGLLVSLHTMHLANLSASRQPEPNDELSRQRVFRIRRFIHRQIEAQEELRRRLDMRIDLPLRGGLAEEGRSADEDLLRANFFLMQLLDQLSLNLCFDRLVFQRVETVYARPGEAAVGGRLGSDGEGAMTLHPWPFNRERVELAVRAARIPSGPYFQWDRLRSAIQSAEPCEVGLVLRPAAG